MSIVSEEYLALAREKAGGVNEAALESLVYWNNPFALKHWTMNVVEILLVAGAAMALLHAWRVYRQRSDPSNLCLWFACIVYLLVTEVPLYFPHLLGLETGLVFFHNEFSVGFLYNQTPLYIAALYPGLIYPCYVLVQQSGIFERRSGLLVGAVCVGFMHHCFYEIFDHFGPQFGWWVWNYENPLVSFRLASVPYTSIVVFSLTPPMVATLLVRGIVGGYARRCQRREKGGSALLLVLLTILVGILIPVTNALLPTSMINGMVKSAPLAKGLYSAAIILSGALTLWTVSRTRAASRIPPGRYPVNFLLAFLVVFGLLWLYAMPEHIAGVGGESARGTPLGSTLYVLSCFLAAGYLLQRLSGRAQGEMKSGHEERIY